MNASTKTEEERPSDGAVLERTFSLVNEAMKTVDLQRRRIRSTEPEDESFAFRYWADLQFLIVTLQRLRRAASIATKVSLVKSEVDAAIKQYDKALPMLKIMRNVGEHIDEYAVDSPRRRNKGVTRYSVQVGTFDGTTYEWLDSTLNIDDAHEAAFELYSAIRRVVKSFPRSI